MRKPFRVPAFVLMSTVALALFGGTASAQITIGQLAPNDTATECEEPVPFDEVQVAVGSGASYAVPAPGGVLTSWSTNAGSGSGQLLELKVYRPAGLGTYTVVGHDGPHALAPSSLNTFHVGIPVQTGDVIGLLTPGEGSATACFFPTTDPRDRGGWKEGNVLDGGTFSLEEEALKFRMNVSATVLPPPTLGTPGTLAGSIAGGTGVVIPGANLAEVRSVSFGSTPAASYIVNSESQITAVAPASATLTAVPITVITPAGSASTASTFAYEGCLVPKLNGKKLKASKKKLKKSDCKLGKVKKVGDATAKTGKVVKQNPKPGKVLAPGTKVGIKLK